MTAIYPGSFDPVTFGHLDIIGRAARIFDRVVVAVMVNSEKHTLFTGEERVEMVRKSVESQGNIEVLFFSGLTIDLCREFAPSVLVKGVRTAVDCDYEAMIAEANRASGGVETVFLPADPTFSRLSATVVREFARHGRDVSKWAPSCVCEALERKFRR